jgi:osmotically-inducible protein OsmY
MTDSQLRQDVLDELEFEPSIDAAHIGVTAEKGVVALTGHVANFSQKLAAVMAVRRVKGVRGIADEIEVRYRSSARTSDDEVAQRALMMLDWDIAVPPKAVNVLVRDGWVTLSGSVNWEFERKSAEDDVRKLDGVRGVINQIEVRPKVQPEDVKAKIEAALKRHAEIEANAIRVSVTDKSNVRLDGKVDTFEQRIAVRNAAWSAPGVSSVEDHLAIA